MREYNRDNCKKNFFLSHVPMSKHEPGNMNPGTWDNCKKMSRIFLRHTVNPHYGEILQRLRMAPFWIG